MPQFVCRLASPTGAVLDRECEAEDVAVLRQRLEGEEHYLFEILPKAAPFYLATQATRRQ